MRSNKTTAASRQPADSFRDELWRQSHSPYPGGGSSGNGTDRRKDNEFAGSSNLDEPNRGDDVSTF